MTNQEAQFILNAYRPGGHDAGEALFGDALQQARQDPALGAWFTREQAHAAAMAAKLRELAPPPDLRQGILTGARFSGATGRARWLRPGWLALAASVAILLAATAMLWPRRGQAESEQLTAFAVNDVARGHHRSDTPAVNAVRDWLSAPANHLGRGVSLDFAALRANGCRTLDFGGREVIEFCFVRGGSEFHLYAVQRADFPELPAAAKAELGQRQGMSFASWSDGANHYVLVGSPGVADVRGLL